MRKIGIVGGITWRSTVDYYSGILTKCEELHHSCGLPCEVSYPEMSIESLDVSKLFARLGRDTDESSWHQFDDYHRSALERLAAAGCDFAVMASNTPHHRFSAIARGISIPVIDLYEMTARKCASTGAKQALILGTLVTMTSSRFRDEFARLGIQADCPPDEQARGRVLTAIERLQRGEQEGIAQEIGTIVRDSIRKNGMDTNAAVCLGCTELPLAFPEFKQQGSFERQGFRYLNTTAIHVQSVVDFCFSQ